MKQNLSASAHQAVIRSGAILQKNGVSTKDRYSPISTADKQSDNTDRKSKEVQKDKPTLVAYNPTIPMRPPAKQQQKSRGMSL
jgi:hypothetical protein